MGKPAWAAEFEGYARKMLDAHGTPGAVVALAKDGEPLYDGLFGMRDREQGLPVTMDTVFGIASITKSFACVAIMQLQEAGKLRVDDPVVKHLPAFRTVDPERTARMTIHHLMSHTSGIPPLATIYGALARSLEQDDMAPAPLKELAEKVGPLDTYDQLIEFIAKSEEPLLGEPGQYFSYCNDGYGLLGAIVEKLTGQRWEDYVQEHIFAPAGMTRSTVDPSRLPAGTEQTMLYISQPKPDGGEEVVASPVWWEAPVHIPAGLIRSTARDMLRYLEIFRTGGRVGDARILSPESVKAMSSPAAEFTVGQGYGYGLSLVPDFHGASMVGHGGAVKGVASMVLVVPERGITGVALTNLGGSPAHEALQGAINAALGLPLDAPAVALPDYDCPADRLGLYAGEYRASEGAQIKLSVAGGKLVAEMQGKQMDARPVGEHCFAIRVKPWSDEMGIRFLTDETGAIWAAAFGARIVRKVS